MVVRAGTISYYMVVRAGTIYVLYGGACWIVYHYILCHHWLFSAVAQSVLALYCVSLICRSLDSFTAFLVLSSGLIA